LDAILDRSAKSKELKDRHEENTATLIVLEDSSVASLGGGQRVTLEVIKVLRDLYRRILLFDCTEHSAFHTLAQSLVDECVKLSSPQLGPLRRNKLCSALGMLFALPVNLFLILKYLKTENGNDTLIYATTSKSLVLAYLLSLIKDVRYIYHAHLVHSGRSPLSWILRPALNRASVVLCVSETVSKSLSGNRFLLRNPAQDYGCSPKILPESKIVVATFSTLTEIKGIRYFMGSYRFLKRKDMVEYRVYGDGPDRNKLRRLENENVRMMGFCHDVPTLLADEIFLVVIPSIIAEACPMTLLEAFSFGIPVIGTNLGGIAELLYDGKTGFQVPPKNSEAIAEKIEYFLDNPDEYTRCSSEALSFTKSFDVDVYRKNVRRLFQSV
jgi:glycosyltransferase involved in cell wall biosynthesis